MTKALDLTGQTFGRLLALHRVENSKQSRARWYCRCECGTEVVVLAGNLSRGFSASCGCRQGKFTHGRSHVTGSLYPTWESMKQRTTNRRNTSYKNYGARGVRMLAEWEADFAAFEAYILDTLGPRPDGMTLDRIDNDGSYVPGNLRWATKLRQAQNRRQRRLACSFEGCVHLSTTRGLCQSHARQAAKSQGLRPLRGYRRLK